MHMDREQRAAWGPLIRESRKTAGMDQAELAEAAGTTRRTIGSIERGTTVPQQGVLERILDVLGLRATEEEEADTDVEAFLGLLRVLLLRLSPAERAAITPKMVELLADALRASGDETPPKFAGLALLESKRRARIETIRQRGLSAADPNVEHLYDEPSAAQPLPSRDVEGDLDPEDT